MEKTFVLHDDSVNTYGYRMLTEGVNLEVFKKNPVMLLNHEDWSLPIGRWDNIRIENNKVVAEPIFDMEDETARKVATKVKSGFLRAASVGAWVDETSSDEIYMLDGQKGPTVTKWTLREASICTIGANHNALVLYDANDNVIALEDHSTVLELMDVTHKKTINKNDIKMNDEVKKLLSLSDDVSDEQMIASIKGVLSDNRAMKKQLEEIKEASLEANRQEAITLVDKAIEQGKINIVARDKLLKLFASDHDSAKVVLSNIPLRKNVSQEIEQSKNSTIDKLCQLSWDELDRKDGALEMLKMEAPEIYKEKFNEKFK